MTHAISPGVERAAETAARYAREAGAPAARLADWMRALLDDDEGRPFELLARLGIDGTAVRERLKTAASAAAPSDARLFAAARSHALRLRGEVDLTTDLILYAIMAEEPAFQTQLADWGLPAAVVEGGLRNGAVVAPDEPGATFDASAAPLGATASHHRDEDAARIVDANLNRARESLRVLDDYARFARNGRPLTEQLKSLRHRLARAGAELPREVLLRARDTGGDVGTALTVPGEYERASPAEVAAVNFKRLQESLRSLEEFGKCLSGEFAQEIEQIRYQAYTLERTAFAANDARERLADARLYVLLSGLSSEYALERTIREAAAGGASVFQLREKSMSDRELLSRARMIRDLTRQCRALFIVNDRPDIARLAEADGVHLGQDDLPASDARQIVGPDALVGISTHHLEQVERAIREGADYIGVGPTFPSTTKSFEVLAGLSFVREAVAASSIPAFALGGIHPDNVAQVVAAGANRIAVSAAVTTAPDPQRVARLLMDSLATLR